MLSMADESVSQQLAKKGMLGVGKLLYEHLASDSMPCGNPQQLKSGKAAPVTPNDTPTAAAPRKLKVADPGLIPTTGGGRAPP